MAGTMTAGTHDVSAVASATPVRLLVVDDEPRICQLISRRLTDERFHVDVASDGRTGLRLARSGAYRLVILDLVMAGMDGHDVLRSLLASRPNQAVIVVSCLSDAPSKVRCLEGGARDYLAKPFSLDELVARVRLRLQDFSGSGRETFAVAGVTLHQDRLEADTGDGPVPLTRREFVLLHELASRAGQTLSKEELLRTVWGYHFDPGTNVVDVYVRRLRAKLGPDVITTVRGRGYCLGEA